MYWPSEDLPRIEDVRIDGLVLLFTVGSAVGAAILFGIVPALQGSRFQLADSLKDRGTVATSGARKMVRNAVVVVEVASSLVLLIGGAIARVWGGRSGRPVPLRLVSCTREPSRRGRAYLS